MTRKQEQAGANSHKDRKKRDEFDNESLKVKNESIDGHKASSNNLKREKSDTDMDTIEPNNSDSQCQVESNDKNTSDEETRTEKENITEDESDKESNKQQEALMS